MNNNIITVNTESERLTIEELRSIKGFENITENESDDISKFIDEIAEILYQCEF